MSLLTSLISFWKLNEASGDAVDSHGSNTLTDTNTVASASALGGTVRDFESSNSEYFTIASNASLVTGDIDFSITAWVQLESIAAVQTIASKRSASAGQIEWFLRYRQATSRFDFVVSTNGSAASIARVESNNLGAPSAGTPYFIVAWHDSVNNTINIQVNNGTVDTVAHAGGVHTSTQAFRIGANDDSPVTEFLDGLGARVGFWKKVLTSGERTALYNNGIPLQYPFYIKPQLIDAGIANMPGLVNGGLIG